MDILQAKETVIQAGKQLLATGLIARTWGNVSCRIDNKSFVITPSGKAYDSLTPDDIVLVNMEDLSYEGDVKPSSEKGIHAQCYLLRPECNFVIHTHQKNASVISVLGYDINNITGESRDLIGDNVPVAAYGLSGTGKLRKAVVAALKRSDSKAVIMRHHGAVCLGKDYDEAFAITAELEKVCERFVFERYQEVTNKAAESFRDICDYVGELRSRAIQPAPQFEAIDSERAGNVVIFRDKDGNEKATLGLAKENMILGEWSSEIDMHCAIYKRRADVRSIIQSKDESVVAASKVTKVLRPMLDDFAQIAGTTIKNVTFDPHFTTKTAPMVAKALGKHKTAALLKDNGAVCVGPTRDEAEASEMVTAKNAKAFVASRLFPKAKYVGKVDALLENVVYRLKYSKQK